MISNMVLSLRNVLAPAAALEVAKVHLKNARETENSELALTFCGEAITALSRIRRSVRKTLVASSCAEDRSLRNEIAATYLEFGRLLDRLESRSKAKACYMNVEKWGGSVQEPSQSSSRRVEVASLHVADPNADTAANIAINPTSSTIAGPADIPTSAPPPPSTPPPPSLPLLQDSRARDIALLPPNIFAKDMYQPPDINNLPRVEERLESISQLVHCLDLLQPSQPPDDPLDQTEINWLNAIKDDPDEQERLKMLVTNLLREFAREEIKDANAVAEIVCLVPVLEKDDLQQLLRLFSRGIEQSKLLDSNLIEGLAQLVQRAVPGHLNSDDLIKILELISTCLQDTHKQSQNYIYQLTLTVSHVLDAMADSSVKGLDRERLHAPLAAYLHGLEGSSDPYLVYQAAYASQALLYVPDNETPWQATVRRTGKVVKGVSGLVSAVKGLDLNRFVEGLSHIQEGLAGASEVVTLAKNAYKDASTLTKNGKQFLDCLKEGFAVSLKRAWYPALRGADILLRNGHLIGFKRLVCEAPCRRDPVFQWGVCQRLGEIAANTECDDDSRTGSVALLGEMYQNDSVWGQDANIKQWIVDILVQLAAPSGSAMKAANALLLQLEKDGDDRKQALYWSYREKGPSSHPLEVILSLPMSPSLLDRVQNKVDVEATLRQLKERRLQSGGEFVYVSPQAKANLTARDDTLFPLMEKVKEFLGSEQKVFLLLGDSGAGKSTFSQQLERELWESYKKKEGRIPLFIALAAIQTPKDELIAKQLKKEGFTEHQIREMKVYREFILICDGYDESRQTHNLYMSNRLNQPGEWHAQMVISCRSEYLGIDYRDRFQLVDRNHQVALTLFQEAVIAPFSKDQIEDYVNQFTSLKGSLWQAADYLQALDRIPNMKDLVTNPFLLTLSLDVLPGMVDPGQTLSATRITRVALYDQFVEQWLERGKKRLVEKVSDNERAAFESLYDEGFAEKGISFLKRLATAIFDNQAGNSVVEYSSARDRGTWKEAFFNQDAEKKLLREACPLNRIGNQYRFFHRSLLEYSLARAVFEPQKGRKDGQSMIESTTTALRRGSTSSSYSFESQGALEEVQVAVEQPVVESPLGRKSFVGEPSIIRFLVERVQQEALFKKQLLAVIERSRTEQKELEAVRKAAANAITILVRAGVQFNGADLRGIQIPGADLSHGVFDCAQLQGADMRKVALRSAWLRGADLSNAQMAGVQFGELPFLQGDSNIEFCVYSPNRETFTTSLAEGEISIFTTSNWEKVWMLRGHSKRIWSVAYSPQGDQIASGSEDTTVRLWDIETGECRHILSGHGMGVQIIAYSPRGDQIASGSKDNTVRLWNLETGECRHTLSGHSNWVRSIAYSAKGDEIASGSDDFTVRLWDVETGDCHYTLSGHSDKVHRVVYSPRGGQVASSSWDNTVRLWNIETGECRHTLSDRRCMVMIIAYSPKGDQIASISSEETVRLWDVETGECRHILSGHNGIVSSIAYSPKDSQIASASRDKTVRLWDTETGDCHHTLSGYSDCIMYITYSPRGDQIASIGEDNTVWLRDIQTGDYRSTLSGHGKSVWSIAYSPKDDQIASGSEDNTVRLWDVETGDCHHTLSGYDIGPPGIAYSPSGGQIASVSWNNTVQLWDVETGECRHTLIGHTDNVMSVAYSPKVDQIASGSSDNTVRLWDIETGECRHTLIGHVYTVKSVAYSPKGDQIASGSYDKTVRLWDTESGECRHTLSGHYSGVLIIAYSPRGSQIASGSWDYTVRLWDVETGECHHTLSGHYGKVTTIKYSPKGDQIASSSEDKSVLLWDLETGECRYTLSGHSNFVQSIAYSPKGDQIASSSDDCEVRLWDVTSGQCRVVIQNYAKARSVAWRSVPNGYYLVVGCEDGSVLQWQVIVTGNEYCVRLRWRSLPNALILTDTSIPDVRGLSRLNKLLLKQRGAIFNDIKNKSN